MGATRPAVVFLWTVVKNIKKKKKRHNIEASQSVAVDKGRFHQQGSLLLIQNVDWAQQDVASIALHSNMRCLLFYCSVFFQAVCRLALEAAVNTGITLIFPGDLLSRVFGLTWCVILGSWSLYYRHRIMLLHRMSRFNKKWKRLLKYVAPQQESGYLMLQLFFFFCSFTELRVHCACFIFYTVAINWIKMLFSTFAFYFFCSHWHFCLISPPNLLINIELFSFSLLKITHKSFRKSLNV